MLDGTKSSLRDKHNTAGDITPKQTEAKFFIPLKGIKHGSEGTDLPSPLSPLHSPGYIELSPHKRAEAKARHYGQALPEDWQQVYTPMQVRDKLRVIVDKKNTMDTTDEPSASDIRVAKI